MSALSGPDNRPVLSTREHANLAVLAQTKIVDVHRSVERYDCLLAKLDGELDCLGESIADFREKLQRGDLAEFLVAPGTEDSQNRDLVDEFLKNATLGALAMARIGGQG